MLRTSRVGASLSRNTRLLSSSGLRLFMFAALVFTCFPGAQTVGAQQAPTFGSSASMLPRTVGVYSVVNLNPDDAQRAPLTRLWDYYMQNPEIQSQVQPALDSMIRGMSWNEVREGMATWVGHEAFFAIPTPRDAQSLFEMTTSSRSSMMSGPPSDLPILTGIAVRNPTAMLAFFLTLPNNPTGSDVSSVNHNGVAVSTIVTDSGTYYMALPSGWLLFAGSQQVIFDALDRTPTNSLASNPTFQEALRGQATAPLALVYADNPSQSFVTPETAGFSPDFTAWTAATIRYDARGLRIDQTNGNDPSKMTAAQRALVTAAAPQMRTARLAPANSAVLLAQSHINLIWNVVKETIERSPSGSDFRQGLLSFEAETGLNVDRDIFGWMTGELGAFVAPGGEEAPMGFGVALAIEAPDPTVAQARVARFMDVITATDTTGATITVEQIAGNRFNKLSSRSGGDNFVLYLGTVGAWVIAADDASLVTGLAARAAGGADQGLAGDSGFSSVRALLPNPSQSIIYVDITRLTDMILSASSPYVSPSEAAQARSYLAPFKRIAMGGSSTLERTRATTFIEIQVP